MNFYIYFHDILQLYIYIYKVECTSFREIQYEQHIFVIYGVGGRDFVVYGADYVIS